VLVVTDMKFCLMVFDSKRMRRTIKPKREEVPESWRNLHIEQIHNL
jgi:hypothetical protein